MNFDHHFDLHSFEIWDEFIKIISSKVDKESKWSLKKCLSLLMLCAPHSVGLPHSSRVYLQIWIHHCLQSKKRILTFCHTYSGGQGSVLQALWFSGGLLSRSQKLFWTMELSSNLLQTTSCLWTPLRNRRMWLAGEQFPFQRVRHVLLSSGSQPLWITVVLSVPKHLSTFLKEQKYWSLYPNFKQNYCSHIYRCFEAAINISLFMFIFMLSLK